MPFMQNQEDVLIKKIQTYSQAWDHELLFIERLNLIHKFGVFKRNI